MRFPLRPLLIPTSPPTPLGVEATYLLPPSKGKQSLLAFFSPLLMRFSGLPRSQRVPPSPPPPTRPPLPIQRRPLDVEATYRRPPSEGKHFLLDRRCPFLTLFQRFLALFCVCRHRTTLEPPSATLRSPPRPLATPSILVSNFNMSRARSEPRPREMFDFSCAAFADDC